MIIDRLHPLIQRFRAPAGEGTDAGGGAADDRGDDWTPEDDDTAASATTTAGKGDTTTTAATTGAGEDDADPDTDADADADADAGKDGKDKDGKDKDGKDKGRKDDRVPLSRHKAVLQKEREAREAVERQLAQYQGGERVAATNDSIKRTEDRILGLDKEYTKLLTDGEHEKAAEKRAQIRVLENEVIELKSDMKAAAASSQAVERMRYDITVERLEAAYPVLDPNDESHDADAAQDVLDLSITYRRRGMTPAEAIQQAAKKLLGAATRKQETATTVTPRVDQDEAEEAAAKAAKEAERKKTQVAKNVVTSGKQPPDTTKRGADSDRAGGGINPKDVLKMTQDDFNKLDDAMLSRLRGDVVA